MYGSIVQLWTAEVHFSSDIPQYEEEGPDYSKVIPSLPKQVVSPLKSHSLCYSTRSQLSISESFLSALQNKQLSLMPPSFAPSPLPFLSPSVSRSPCHSCSFAGWWEASEGMSKRHLRQVCERHSVILVERDVSLRACLWSYPQPGDNRWCRRKDNPGNHPGAGWQCGEVTMEREYTGAEGSSGRVWAGSSVHVPSFKLCFCLSDATPSPSLPPLAILFLPNHSLHVEPHQLDRHWQALAACVHSDRLLFLTLCLCLCVHACAHDCEQSEAGE